MLSVILAVPIWTPWPWVGFVMMLALLTGAGLLVAAFVRRSALLAAAGIVLMLLVGAVYMALMEQAAERQKRSRTRPAATRPAGD